MVKLRTNKKKKKKKIIPHPKKGSKRKRTQQIWRKPKPKSGRQTGAWSSWDAWSRAWLLHYMRRSITCRFKRWKTVAAALALNHCDPACNHLLIFVMIYNRLPCIFMPYNLFKSCALNHGVILINLPK